jgi:hypothetical protein
MSGIALVHNKYGQSETTEVGLYTIQSESFTDIFQHNIC